MVKKSTSILLTLFSICAMLVNSTPARSSRWKERAKWGKYFAAAKLKGTFLLYDLQADRYIGYNLARARQGYIPASTFKIFNSLAALEVGAVKNAEEVLPWDGKTRKIANWNQNQSMRDAFHYSTVWFYQEMARRVGYQCMGEFINAAGYGNHNIAGGVDRFWLDGELRISALEQIEFLVKLYRHQLPFSPRTIDMVKDIFIYEKTDQYVLRAKTGWGLCVNDDGKRLPNCEENGLGWWVGYLERDGKVYFFALNLDIIKDQDAKMRIEIAKSILREMKLIS